MVASGGGRELLARDPASIHPISPTTDHLGALVLAPLNIDKALFERGLDILEEAVASCVQSTSIAAE